MSAERKKILEMVSSGQLTAEQAATLLDLVAEPEPLETQQGDDSQPVAAASPAAEPAWREGHAYWLYPLFAGTVVMLIGGTVVANAYQQSRVGLGTWICGWIPLSLGLLTIILAAWVRTARWIHLRVIGKDDRLSLAFPLPLRLGALVLTMARPFIPQLRKTAVDELILTLRESLADDQPITIEVEDEEEGEYVQIYIG